MYKTVFTNNYPLKVNVYLFLVVYCELAYSASAVHLGYYSQNIMIMKTF